MRYIKSIEQTCGACPSQWEGELDDGNWFYVRYRWGTFRVGIGKTIDEAVCNTVFSCLFGDSLLSGFMTNNEMLKLLADNLQIYSTQGPDGRLRKS